MYLYEQYYHMKLMWCGRLDTKTFSTALYQANRSYNFIFNFFHKVKLMGGA